MDSGGHPLCVQNVAKLLAVVDPDYVLVVDVVVTRTRWRGDRDHVRELGVEPAGQPAAALVGSLETGQLDAQDGGLDRVQPRRRPGL